MYYFSLNAMYYVDPLIYELYLCLEKETSS